MRFGEERGEGQRQRALLLPSRRARVAYTGTSLVPFCPSYFGISLLKLNGRKKGTLIINGLPGNLV